MLKSQMWNNMLIRNSKLFSVCLNLVFKGMMRAPPQAHKHAEGDDQRLCWGPGQTPAHFPASSYPIKQSLKLLEKGQQTLLPLLYFKVSNNR